MRAVKKINNNTVICVDSGGMEIVAMGKGIGYPAVPREVPLEEIERTFYDVKSSQLQLFTDIPDEVMLFTAKIIDIAKNELPDELSPNAVFTLADHIAFCIERARKQIHVRMPLAYDVEQMYPKEYRIGKYAVSKIRKQFQVAVLNEEAVGIAMSLVNSEIYPDGYGGQSRDASDESMLEDITEIVESEYHIIIDRETFSYARYATHLQYLFQRIHEGKTIDTDNLQMYGTMQEEYPELTACVDKIGEHLKTKWKCELSEEEKLYIGLHVNRICIKEGM
ncbi:MAG: PRD domain-containing protein [Lachnospiraceae bacterium]|nr:PRD domain-containing protein [Lachnospiraceae bacterium]